MATAVINEYLDAHRQQHLDKLFELLRIPSIANNNDGACNTAANWLVQYMSDLGVKARVAPTPTQPVVMGHLHVSDAAPTVLVYGHYDVQPATPLELWNSPPFEPTIRDGNIYARGADDDKGQLFGYLMALEAYVRTDTPLPVNLKFLIEGEEEIGSPSLEGFLRENLTELACDAVLISDSAFFAEGLPSITYALRGVGNGEFFITEANSDSHSGIHGGTLRNPLHVVCEIVAAMRDADGRIMVPGFYDDVLTLTPAQRESWSKLPFDEGEYARSLGLDHLGGGERGYSVLERLWARPTLDINGIVGGYAGKGGKTVIPGQASAKFSFRSVPNQDPHKLMDAIEQFVAARVPMGMKFRFEVGSANPPVLLGQDTPAMQAAKEALQEVFGAQTAMICCGASVSVSEMFQRMLGVDAVMMGFGLPDDNLHAPNEKYALSQFYNAAKTIAATWAKMSR